MSEIGHSTEIGDKLVNDLADIQIAILQYEGSEIDEVTPGIRRWAREAIARHGTERVSHFIAFFNSEIDS